eukprot:6102496-Alexandrium_andersonii.AAC.1
MRRTAQKVDMAMMHWERLERTLRGSSEGITALETAVALSSLLRLPSGGCRPRSLPKAPQACGPKGFVAPPDNLPKPVKLPKRFEARQSPGCNPFKGRLKGR